MPFYLYSTPDGLSYRHDEHPIAVTVLDESMNPLGAKFATFEDSDCATSVTSNRFAIGYWRSRDLELFELTTGEPVSTFPFRQVGPLATFDASGKRLLFKSGSKTFLLDTTTASAVQIKGVRALDRLHVIWETNQAIVPSHRKDELLSLDLESGSVTEISLPFNATLFDLKPNPCGSQLIAIDRKKRLHCIDCTEWSLVWTKSFKHVLQADHMGVGQFCGDGSLFGAAVSARGRKYTLVVDSETGELVNQLNSVCYGLPHAGTEVRDQASASDTFLFRTLDLRSGVEGEWTAPS